MKARTKVKRAGVKLHRKVFGSTKEVRITTGKGGLTKSEIKDVLATLTKAVKDGRIPSLAYQYRPPTIVARRETILITPESVPVATARVRLRAMMKDEYGARYIVD